MSSWGVKLEKKLNALADGASKESMQTLANWLHFNRKHAPVFAKTFEKSLLATTTEGRQWMYWQLIHEVLMRHRSDSAKWDKAATLRETLGEVGIVPALEGLKERVVKEKVEVFLKQWDDHNVFGGPTIIGQIRRLLAASASKGDSSDKPDKATTQAPPVAATDTPATADPAKKVSKTTAAASATAPSAAKQAGDTSATKDASSKPSASRRESMASTGSATGRRGSLSSIASTDVIEYDFESKNIPAGKVESREFLGPCKTVATLQIGRDVRTNVPVELDSLLKNLPKDIQEKRFAPKDDFDKAMINEFSFRMPAKLLDVKFDAQRQTIATLQDTIRRQKTAREELIRLLVKSRCQFGSNEAARQYYDLQATSEKLRKRKQLLGDALELEGLDSELDTTNHEDTLKGLKPLTWYEKSTEGSGSSAKRKRSET